MYIHTHISLIPQNNGSQYLTQKRLNRKQTTLREVQLAIASDTYSNPHHYNAIAITEARVFPNIQRVILCFSFRLN